MEIERIIDELTVEEKIALVSGTDFMYTNPVPRLGIPSVRMSDGPHGVRVQNKNKDNGTTVSEPSTAFPTAATVASSWNEENSRMIGEALAKECRHYGVGVLLGPAVNIKRNPLAGRNFEYFSEDPLLAGRMGAAQVRGVQSGGVGVSVKHFALNNSENYRFMGDSVCDARAAAEIYLKPFEIIVKESAPETLMCAYNKINGTFCSENEWLLGKVLREKWGYGGLVMTDWGAVHCRVAGVKAGLDLEMPGDTAICRKWLYDALKSGELKEEELNKAVRNVLTLVSKHGHKPEFAKADFIKHHGLAAEIAADSAVLMKNDGVLPLKSDAKYCVAGDLFEKMRYQGAGSSLITPAFLSTPKSAFDDSGVSYKFCRGYAENAFAPDDKLIGEAVAASGDCDVTLVFAGLTDYFESEGADRENMRLPENQLALIDALILAGRRVAVVLYGGSPVELPFADKVSAILNMYLPGQNGGKATYDLLFGIKSPCGKLAETWVKEYREVPFGGDFGKTQNEIYKESVFVGYRYYLTAGKDVRYPFGYGLSYTEFDYKNMQVEETACGYKASCEIVNCGERDGAEIVQLYAVAPQGTFRPAKELRGFAKVYLKAGESKRVDIYVKREDLGYYNAKEDGWVIEGGKYEFQLCSDCRTVKLSQVVSIAGDGVACPYSEKVNSIYSGAQTGLISDGIFEEMSGLKIPASPPSRPVTLESRFTDTRQSFLGNIVYRAVLGMADGKMRRAKRLPEGVERDNKIKAATFLRRILDSNCLRSMSMTSGKRCPYNIAECLVHLSNGKIFKGLKCAFAKIKAPELPKNVKPKG